MPIVEMLCLANLRKHNGRCIAGLRSDGQGWIRLVGLNEDGRFFRAYYTLPDRSEARLLDVLRVLVRSSRAQPHQPGNTSSTMRRARCSRGLPRRRCPAPFACPSRRRAGTARQ